MGGRRRHLPPEARRLKLLATTARAIFATVEKRDFPANLVADIERARETKEWTISGPKSRIELDDEIDESDELVGLQPFGLDGGGGVWYCDVDNRLMRGAGSIIHLHMSCGYGDARYVATSYEELLRRLADGLDPYELPSFNAEALPTLDGLTHVPGIEAPVEVKRVHARTHRAAEVVCAQDALAAGLPARGGEPIHLTDEGRVHFLTLAAQALVDGIPCAAGTALALHPTHGRPLRFTPAEPLELDGLPLRAGHEVTVYDQIFSAGVTGVLDRDHDVAGVPLAAGTRVTLHGQARSLMSGTLRCAAVVAGQRLEAGTWFELLGETLYRTRTAGQ
jgi:hypothetical protein